MGYDTKGFLEYERRYSKTRKALDYLWVAHFCHNGDKEKMIESAKRNLRVLKDEFEISATIEAIKILKRNLTIQIGIKTEPI